MRAHGCGARHGINDARRIIEARVACCRASARGAALRHRGGVNIARKRTSASWHARYIK